MKVMRGVRVFTLIAGLAFAQGVLGQNLVRNGSFEIVNHYPFDHAPYWSVGAGYLVYPESQTLGAAEGQNVVRLAGTGYTIEDGTVWQIIPTIAGGMYQLRFAERAPVYGSSEYAGNIPSIGPYLVNVTLNDSLSGTFQNETTTWQYFTLNFLASGPTKIGFYPQPNFAGPYAGWPFFDDVSVVAVPEPRGLSILAAGLLVLLIRIWKRSDCVC
jgi:hypothetical protein